jgi:nucleotide-binding universal stress UspA family protein
VVWATSAADLEAVLEGAVNEARERLRELGRKLRESRPAVTAEVLRGDPASSIIASAQEQTADLVILGSHGEGGIDRWLLGSVSERVARHAPCSVLVVR